MRSITRRSVLLSTAGLAALELLSVRLQAAVPRVFGDVAGFLRAVRAGDVADVGRRLDAEPSLLACEDERGCSALVVAVLAGEPAVVQLLLERGFEPDVVEAAMIPDWERVERLAATSPELLNAAHAVGGTALYAAARMGCGELWRLQGLGARADANPAGERGVTPAYGALECEDPIGARIALVDLLSNGADVNAHQRGGDSLLHAAARRGDAYLVRYVLRRGGDADARDARGETPLEVAVGAGHEEAAALLRHPERVPRDHASARHAWNASGEPVVWPDLSDVSWRRQAEVTSVSHGNLPRVRELVEADPRLAFSFSMQRELSIEACAHTGARHVIRFYLDRGLPQSLATSLSVGDLDRAAALLDEEPLRVHERGPHDFPMMWYPAISGGSVAAAELLLNHDADVDQECLGATGLHQAAARGQRELVSFLIEAGADVDAVAYRFERAGQTPAQFARARGQEPTARLLEERGAR